MIPLIFMIGVSPTGTPHAPEETATPTMTDTPQTPELTKKNRLRHLLWAVPLTLALAAAITVWAGRRSLERWAMEPFGSAGVHALTIQPGTSARMITRQLKDAGLVSDDLRLLAWLRLHGQTSRLQAGEYKISAPIAPQSLVGRLGHGAFTRRLTIPEGWTARQIADHLKSEGLIDDPGVWLALMARPLAASVLGEAMPGGSEGFCFPETYDINKGATTEQIHQRMLAEFKSQWLQARPGERDPLSAALTMAQVVTLASMIQREARTDEEMPTIASVYLNRLKKGMKMQCCATVRYALGEVWDRPLKYADLKVDSPFNTYLHTGLPPAPIANPGRAAIEAVLRPAHTDYLFYVYRGEGHHIFSRTHAEHLKAIRLAREGNPQAAITGQNSD